ncbi:response regulator transcription factor [Pseudochrobactrum asaccharolyticum]|jgi:DNA-binding NarL/FixJ family response regulator|uniref:Flagellar transcriptional regulator FtcR n=1 Tax=Pseudochrobactrum asaccharolyticum TaxID=354351 RepID=A0A366E7Y7_9HYPH|nr:LuxR family two component transcriptional regulator [Pseudochrobactrum asaccharolyticum]
MNLNFIIADDHPLFRGALRQILQDSFRPESVTEAENYQQLELVAEEAQDVDLLFLDLTMPGVSGLSGLINLKAQYPQLPVMIVSATDDVATIRRAMDLGASGFVSKSASLEEIGEAVRTVLDGGEWVSGDMELGAENDAEIADLIARIRALTPQQTRVLSMLGQGLLNKQLAYELKISEATVKAHVSAVLQKLGVDSRTQAVILLSKLGPGFTLLD